VEHLLRLDAFGSSLPDPIEEEKVPFNPKEENPFGSVSISSDLGGVYSCRGIRKMA
jgi:hypothetical protein